MNRQPDRPALVHLTVGSEGLGEDLRAEVFPAPTRLRCRDDGRVLIRRGVGRYDQSPCDCPAGVAYAAWLAELSARTDPFGLVTPEPPQHSARSEEFDDTAGREELENV